MELEDGAVSMTDAMVLAATSATATVQEATVRAAMAGSSRDRRRVQQNGAGPANGLAPRPAPLAPLAPVVPDWLLAGPAAPMLGADENVEAARAAAPPPFWCPSHGWVVCPLHEYGPAVRRSSASIFEFGGTSSAAAIDAGTITPRLPSPTPAVVEMEGDALAYLSVPTGAPNFTVDSGVRSFTGAAVADSIAPLRLSSPTPAVEDNAPHGNAAVVNVVASRLPSPTPRLPSPTPATPPPSPRARASRRLTALGFTLSPPLGGRAGRSGTWNPAALGFTDGVSNGVAPGTWLPGGSSDEDIRRERSSAHR